VPRRAFCASRKILASGIGFLLFDFHASSRDQGDRVGRRKAESRSTAEETISQSYQLLLAIRDPSSLASQIFDERTNAPAGCDRTRSLKFAVDLGNGVSVDPEIDSKLPDRRQLVPGP
jgi:hypothetical protein